ncbi:protein-export protein [Streptococcus sp. KR]|nr:protein-export protein [Streptococcus sp. KR]
MFHFYHCHKSLPSARNNNIVFSTTNILNPYFLNLLHFIITEGSIPTYYSPIKTEMQAFACSL